MSSTTQLLTPRETADRLGVAPKTLAKWRCESKGPAFVRVGSRIMYSAADVEAFITALPRRTSTSVDQ